MADIQQLILDPDKQNKGVWVKYDLDTELLIGNTNSQEFRKACAELLEPFRQKIRTKGIEFAERIEIIKPAIAEHLHKGWKNLSENGKQLIFSPKEALRIYELLPDMPIFVLGSADEKEWFRKEFLKASEKNSKIA